MKKVFLLLAAALSFTAIFSQALEARDTYVRGYTRSDGTVVQPYYRTAPDNTINNNYSTYPNVNPYTGREGTVAPNPYQPYAPYSPYGTAPVAPPYGTP